MFRCAFSFLSGLVALIMASIPSSVHAADWEYRQAASIARQQAGMYALQDFGVNNPDYYGQSDYYYGQYAYPAPVYDPYYGTSSYPSYSPYSTYPSYPNPYMYPRYRAYYYNPGMYNPDTSFVNPPSSLNYRTGYPRYSQSYIYP